MANIGSEIKRRFGEEALVFASKANEGLKTYDGIEVCAGRLYDEVLDIISSNPQLTKISVIGYSFGGLVARFLIGRAFVENFWNLTPVNFVTMASPHLGIYSDATIAKSAVKRSLGLTGEELALIDANAMLIVMTLPESTHVKGLKCFERRFLYGNIDGDWAVPYPSALIRCALPPKHRQQPPRFISASHPHVWYVDDDDGKIILSTRGSTPTPPSLSEDRSIDGSDSSRSLGVSEEKLGLVSPPSPVPSDEADMSEDVAEQLAALEKLHQADAEAASNFPRWKLMLALPVFALVGPPVFFSIGAYKRMVSKCPTRIQSLRRNLPNGEGVLSGTATIAQLEEAQAIRGADGVGKPDVVQEKKDKLIAFMCDNLNKLSWCKVAVRFPRPAHAAIVHRHTKRNINGADVVNYMVSHLLLGDSISSLVVPAQAPFPAKDDILVVA